MTSDYHWLPLSEGALGNFTFLLNLAKYIVISNNLRTLLVRKMRIDLGFAASTFTLLLLIEGIVSINTYKGSRVT